MPIAGGPDRRLPGLTDQEQIALDDALASVSTSLAKCEEILATPIPLGYTRYSVRFLWVWLTLLPFALTRTFCGFQAGTWWEGKVDEPWPLVSASVSFIAAILLSIEDIAVQIEEPFAILPLEFQHMWLLRDVEKTRSLMKWSLQRQDGKPQRAAAVRPSELPSARLARTRVSSEQSAASRPMEPRSAGERLAQLQELVDAGLITDAEYDEKRQGIMSAL